MKLIGKNELASDVISHDVSPLTVHTDARGYARLGWIIILVGVVGSLAWAVFAPLDKGVPISGFVSKESSRKQVQHQTGGTVEKILVHDGDVVKAGQVLVRMNSVQSSAVADGTKTQMLSARATEMRLLAERDNKPALSVPAGMMQFKDDPMWIENFSSQTQLLSARRSSFQNEMGAVDENIAGLKAQAAGLIESRDSKKQQMVYLKEQLDNMRDLSKDGYVARSRVLDLERTYAQLSGAISEDIGSIGRTQRQVAELILRRAMRQQDYQKDVRSQLADAQRDAETLERRYAGQQFEVNNAEVKAPADGVVMGVNVFTNGGVVGPGFRMMDIVPSHDALVVEGQMPVNLVDRVHVGLPVELMFSAFNTNTTPHVPGELTQISADRLVDERTGTPYYKVRAKVTPEGLKLISQNKLDVQPGMPVELFVKTGQRSMMSYLLKPLFDRAKTAMSEE
jgi:protease secretion system membrane fusion protein